MCPFSALLNICVSYRFVDKVSVTECNVMEGNAPQAPLLWICFLFYLVFLIKFCDKILWKSTKSLIATVASPYMRLDKRLRGKHWRRISVRSRTTTSKPWLLVRFRYHNLLVCIKVDLVTFWAFNSALTLVRYKSH